MSASHAHLRKLTHHAKILRMVDERNRSRGVRAELPKGVAPKKRFGSFKNAMTKAIDFTEIKTLSTQSMKFLADDVVGGSLEHSLEGDEDSDLAFENEDSFVSTASKRVDIQKDIAQLKLGEKLYMIEDDIKDSHLHSKKNRSISFINNFAIPRAAREAQKMQEHLPKR